MKVVFVVDNIPAMEMFIPIIRELPKSADVMFLNVDGWTKEGRIAIARFALKNKVACKLLEEHTPIGISKMINCEKPDIFVFSREETTPAIHYLLNTKIPTLFIPHGMLTESESFMWGSINKYHRIIHGLRLLKQGINILMRGRISYKRWIQTGIFRLKNDFKYKGILSRYDRFTKIASYGEYDKKVMVRYYVNPDNIIITGNTKLDSVYKIREYKGECVLLFTDYLVEFGLWTKGQRLEYLKTVSNIVLNITGKKLKVKIHPISEKLSDYEEIKNKYNLPIEIYQREPLSDLMKECKIGLTLLSSTGLETMVAGRPLVIYNPYHNGVLYKGVAYYTEDSKELYDILKELWVNGMDSEHKKLADDFIYQRAYMQDGKAGQRIAELIINMVKE